MVSRTNHSTSHDRTHPSSHATYANLDTPEKHKCLQRVHLEMKKSKLKLYQLTKRIEDLTKINAAKVDDDLDKDLREMVGDSKNYVVSNYAEGTFQRIFFELQEKATSLRDSRSMK
jgi:hypothetical protein